MNANPEIIAEHDSVQGSPDILKRIHIGQRYSREYYVRLKNFSKNRNSINKKSKLPYHQVDSKIQIIFENGGNGIE